MTIYISIAITFAIVFGILFVLFQKMKAGTDQTTVSMLFAMVIASISICLIFLLPAVILFGTFWGISYALPDLISVNRFSNLFSLSFLTIGIAFIVEIFFSGIFSGVVKQLGLKKPLIILFKSIVYALLLFIMSANLFTGVDLTFLGALIVSAFIILLEGSIEDLYIKRKEKQEGLNSNGPT
ncbi:hypothetical protein P4679_24570 [Priestia megaterium]|uniref:hypothetical protein n=1 Tax=Priestia megaterium TaxID=1404 RepID=UPI002E22920C|nr:hypothetical protein [Priestia megaterium]